MVTSSGMRPSSMRLRLNWNSVFEAEGKPTSISLNPHRTKASKSSSFCETFIGTASAWLPSRRSTLHQIGAAVSVRLGHWRSGIAMGGKGRYLLLDGKIICEKGFAGGDWKIDKTSRRFRPEQHQPTS